MIERLIAAGRGVDRLREEERLFLAVIEEMVGAEIAPQENRIDAEAKIEPACLELVLAQQLDRLAAPESIGGGAATRLLELLGLETIARSSASLAALLSLRQAGLAALVVADRPDLGEPPSLAIAPEDFELGELLSGSLRDVPISGESLLILATEGAFLVEARNWRPAAIPERIGLRGLRIADVAVARTPAVRLGGEEVVAAALAARALGLGACAVGVGWRAVAASESYLDERRQFGRPLAAFGALRAMLAAGASAVAGAAALVGASATPPGYGTAIQAARAAVEAAVEATDLAIQVHGGYGYVCEYVPERLFRDAISLRALVEPASAAVISR